MQLELNPGRKIVKRIAYRYTICRFIDNMCIKMYLYLQHVLHVQENSKLGFHNSR